MVAERDTCPITSASPMAVLTPQWLNRLGTQDCPHPVVAERTRCPITTATVPTSRGGRRCH